MGSLVLPLRIIMYKLISDTTPKDTYYIINHSSGKSMYFNHPRDGLESLEDEKRYWNDSYPCQSLLKLLRGVRNSEDVLGKLKVEAEFDSFEEAYNYYRLLIMMGLLDG